MVIIYFIPERYLIDGFVLVTIEVFHIILDSNVITNQVQVSTHVLNTTGLHSKYGIRDLVVTGHNCVLSKQPLNPVKNIVS